MTAIKEFERLEALGLWRTNAHDQRVEVVISFGDTTLVLSDINNRPLTHWSLAAIEHRGQGDYGTIFAADSEGEETLEIEDPLMIAAISKIRSAIAFQRPKSGRMRLIIGGFFLLAFLFLALFWLPNRITHYAANAVPDAKAQEIGQDLMARIERVTGPACAAPSGLIALAEFEERVLGLPSAKLVVVDMGTRPSLRLPGGMILINELLLTFTDSAEVAAGYVLQERAAEDETPVLQAFFAEIGLRKTLRFLANGRLDQADLQRFGESRLFGPRTTTDPQNLIENFKLATIAHQPFARHRNDQALLTMDGIAPAARDPLLAERSWVALQEICNG